LRGAEQQQARGFCGRLMRQPCRRLQPRTEGRDRNLRANVRLYSASLGCGVETRHAVEAIAVG
jgi:hypothetical protein